MAEENFMKRLARLFCRDYSIYHIYSRECGDEIDSSHAKFRFERVNENSIIDSANEIIVQQAWYCGDCSHAYACMNDSHIVALCFFWYGKRYRTRNFWPLEEGEAKLVQLVVLPQMRGQGIASKLIEFATADMSRLGFRRAYARIWWSNTPSLHAFERAKWRRIATVIDIWLSYRAKPFRLKLTRMLS